MRKYGYVRVSTKEQNEERQLIAMEKQGIRKSDIFIDKATGKNFDRPQWKELKEEITEGDTLFFISVDRLGRTKSDCLKELRELKERGVIVHIEEIPTTMIEVDETNKLIIDMMNNVLIEVYTTLAEEELKKITKRRKEGMEAMGTNEKTGKKVGKSGKVTGRPSNRENLTTQQERIIDNWLEKRVKLAECIQITGLSRATLYRIKKSREEASK